MPWSHFHVKLSYKLEPQKGILEKLWVLRDVAILWQLRDLCGSYGVYVATL